MRKLLELFLAVVFAIFAIYSLIRGETDIALLSLIVSNQFITAIDLSDIQNKL